MTDVPRRDGRVPLTVVGGFLGAGKSTWLRHQLFEAALGSVSLLVNEVADTPVDTLLLERAAHVDVLAGGCACCTGRAGLVDALRAICNRIDGAAADRTDRIVIETSGLADPAGIAAALAADPVLVRRLGIDEVLVLVDARHGVAQLRDEALNRAQIDAATQLVVTKPHGVSPQDLARLVATLRVLNPAATLSAAEFGVPVALPDAADALPHDLPELITDDVPIRAHRLDVSQTGGWVPLSAWLSALLHAHGDRIVRIKGVVRSPAGRLLLQSVRSAVQPPEILPDPLNAAPGVLPEDDVLVMIGRGIDGATLRRSLLRFASPP